MDGCGKYIYFFFLNILKDTHLLNAEACLSTSIVIYIYNEYV